MVRSALIEFSLHGVRYVFPTKPGAQRRGLPTAYAAAPLKTEILSPPGDIPVWPHPEGTVKGSAIEPLCPQVPEAALRDERLYQMLALLDALRIGRARERNLAGSLLKSLIEAPDAP